MYTHAYTVPRSGLTSKNTQEAREMEPKIPLKASLGVSSISVPPFGASADR